MTRNIMIASRLREVLLNGRWIAYTNYREQIQSVNWQQATQKIGNLNTIAALIYHINYYLAGLLKAFENGKLEISDKYSFDLPPITSETDWNELVTDFLTNSEKFADRVEQMDDQQFDKPFIDEKYGTFLRNIEGVIEHSYYHLGQITLLKKLTIDNKSLETK
ncbi:MULTISPECIES: DinB family protein [Flavobacterium]|nr:DinB family protein [Flavobacterium sp. N1846]